MNVIKLHQDRPTTAANLVWEEPPNTERTTGKYAEFAEALRQNPTRWAVFTTVPPTQKKRGWGLSNGINAGKLVDFRPHVEGEKFQAVCRSSDTETRIYVRFLPAVDQAPLAVAR